MVLHQLQTLQKNNTTTSWNDTRVESRSLTFSTKTNNWKSCRAATQDVSVILSTSELHSLCSPVHLQLMNTVLQMHCSLFSCSDSAGFLTQLFEAHRPPWIGSKVKMLHAVLFQTHIWVKLCCLQYCMCFSLLCVLLLVHWDYSTINIYLFFQVCTVLPSMCCPLGSTDDLCRTEICCVERLDGAASLKHPEWRENV